MALKCFIAMAFGNADTDRLYDGTIIPLLDKMGITPFRVDRSNRNEDIDNQIISEIRQCDFVISDLTYARPSVYFEAGFAHGLKVPVIFTCREDHFKHRPDDVHGNLKVHFDLQMKPIVQWNNPVSGLFVKKLRDRIGYVSKPLFQAEKETAAAEMARLAFNKLSGNAKLNRLIPCWKTAFQQHGYKRHKIAEEIRNKVYSAVGGKFGHIYFKRLGPSLSVVMPRDYLTISAKQLGWSNVIPDVKLSEILEKAKSRTGLPKRAEKHIFICVLQKLTRSRVAAALDNYAIEETNFGFVARREPRLEAVSEIEYDYFRSRRQPKPPKQIPVVRCIHLICGIESEPNFKAALKEHLQLETADEVENAKPQRKRSRK